MVHPALRRVSAFVLVALVLLPATALAADSGRDADGFSGRSHASSSPVDALVVLDGTLDRPLEAAFASLGFPVLERFAFIDAVLVRGPASDLERLLRVPGVVGVYPEEALESNLAQSRGLVRADDLPIPPPEAGSGVTIAVVDSGVDGSHPALRDSLRASVRVSRSGVSAGAGDSDGHGTHVAGILAGSGAESANGRHRGLAPGAGIVGVDMSESFTTTTAVRAFEWVHQNHARYDIRVVSNSWGRERDAARFDANDPVVRASNALVAKGLVVVFSAGNKGDDRASLTLEAMNPNVITVGATSKTGRIESYSSRGPAVDRDGRELPWVKPDLVAPGTRIVSTRSLATAGSASGESRFYVEMNGTSMAAPHVAAAAALLLSKEPSLTPELVQILLQDTARDLGPAGPDWMHGYGLLDVAAALSALEAMKQDERIVFEERRIPLRASGHIVAAAGSILLADHAPHLPPREGVRVPVAVPEGTRSLSFSVTWEGPAGGVEVTVAAPDGTRGTHRGDGNRVDVALDSPAAGLHVVTLRATGPATLTAYRLAGELVVLEPRILDGYDALRRSPRGSVSADADFFTTYNAHMSLKKAVETGLPGVLALAAVGAVGVGALARLGRRKAP